MQTLTQQVIEKYALSPEEIKQITKTVISALTYNKLPSKNPIAIVVGGQPGSGKTALINYTKQISSERSFIVIDNDFFRNFHPQAKEIKQNHPNLFTQATDQLGMGITSDVINYCVDNNFDIIFHQTLKNKRIGDDAISLFRESGYTVGVRVFAVPFFESSMSQIERYLGQAEKLGYCRYATQEGHLTAYTGLPNTVEYLEQNGLYDFMQVYTRSPDITCPTLIYSCFNPDSIDKTFSALSNCENISKQTQKHGFLSAKNAVLEARCMQAEELSKTIPERLEVAKSNPFSNQEILQRIKELEFALGFVENNQGFCTQIFATQNHENCISDSNVSGYVEDLKIAMLCPNLPNQNTNNFQEQS